MELRAVNLNEKFGQIQEYWCPRVAGQLNGQEIKLAKVKGTFDWHHHEKEDELFLVVKGILDLELNQGTVTIGAGEFFIVPRGVDHRPVAREEVHLVLFEPASTLNTGNLRNEKTVESPEQI